MKFGKRVIQCEERIPRRGEKMMRVMSSGKAHMELRANMVGK